MFASHLTTSNHAAHEVELLKKRISSDIAARCLNRNATWHLEQLIKLYNAKKNINILTNIFPQLIPALISINKVHKLNKLLSPAICKDAINKANGVTRSFLHFALRAKRITASTIDALIDLLDLHTPSAILFDENGNSLLALCNIKKYYPLFLSLLKDINHQNIHGDTALHFAASADELDKIRFLLAHGANADIRNKKGLTCWEIEGADEGITHVSSEIIKKQKTIDNYFCFRANKAHVLSLPPEIVRQNGLCCGYYAIRCTTQFHRDKFPTLFTAPSLPARKSDPDHNMKQSLRQAGKQLGISNVGEIFSATDMVRIIEKTGCQAIISTIESYDEFIEIITKSIDLDLPVILPFILDNAGNPKVSDSADGAHWATIIGISNYNGYTDLMIAQHGHYFMNNAVTFYQSFFAMPPTHPEVYIIKTNHIKGITLWEKFTEFPIDIDVNNRTKWLTTIPEADLSDFRRKLITVLPPKFDMSLWQSIQLKKSLSL